MTATPAWASPERIYDLGQPLESRTPTSPNHPPFRMALVRRHGDAIRADGGSGANELITMGAHTGTHIDALCHVSFGMKLHGGVDALEASRGGRFQVLGAETIQPIICRGLLLDVPSALDRDALEPAQRVTADDLARACAMAGVEVRPGDAVLIRTGWPCGRYENAVSYIGWETGVPGPDESAAQWLIDRHVAVTGADTIAYEWIGAGNAHTLLPVHTLLLVDSGIHIIEVMALEELARDRAYEFTFIAVPLKLVGATGSPVRPLAVLQ